MATRVSLKKGDVIVGPSGARWTVDAVKARGVWLTRPVSDRIAARFFTPADLQWTFGGIQERPNRRS